MRDSCGKSGSRGDPAGAKAPRTLPDRPQKASAWREDQRSNCTKHKNVEFVYCLGLHHMGDAFFSYFCDIWKVLYKSEMDFRRSK